MVAETAMVVSLAGISDQRQAESEAQDLMARARVAVLDAQIAVTRAMEALAQCHAGRARAQAMVAEARALRARDRSRASLAVGRAAAPDEASPPLIRVSERASAS